MFFLGCSNDDPGDPPKSPSLSSDETDDDDPDDYDDCLIDRKGYGIDKCANELLVVFGDWGQGRCKKRTISFRIINSSSSEIRLTKEVLVIKESDYHEANIENNWITDTYYLPYTVPNNQQHPISFTVEMKNMFKKDYWQKFYDVTDNLTSDHDSNCI